MLRYFFFSIEGSNVVFFFGWILRRLRLHLVSELFLFFSTQSFGQANRACLKKKHLLSLVTCCHWSQGKKKQLGNEAKSSFFFPSIYSFSRVFFVCLAGSIYFVFFLFFLLFFVFFCQMSNLCEKKKKKHPFKFRKLLQIKEKVS